jgi:hypothetical protein
MLSLARLQAAVKKYARVELSRFSLLALHLSAGRVLVGTRHQRYLEQTDNFDLAVSRLMIMGTGLKARQILTLKNRNPITFCGETGFICFSSA